MAAMQTMLLSFESQGIVWKPAIMCDFEQLFTALISGAGSLHTPIRLDFSMMKEKKKETQSIVEKSSDSSGELSSHTAESATESTDSGELDHRGDRETSFRRVTPKLQGEESGDEPLHDEGKFRGTKGQRTAPILGEDGLRSDHKEACETFSMCRRTKRYKRNISDDEESNSTVVDKRKLPKLWFDTRDDSSTDDEGTPVQMTRRQQQNVQILERRLHENTREKHCESDSDDDHSVLGNQPKTNEFPVDITEDTELQFAADESSPPSSESFDQSAEENLDHTNNDLGISSDNDATSSSEQFTSASEQFTSSSEQVTSGSEQFTSASEQTSSSEQSSYSDIQDSSSSESVSDSEQPFCAGTAVKRRTFDAAFLAVSKKHSFSKSARNDLIKFLNTVLPDPNLASSNYTFEKKILEAMDVHFTKYELCVKCNTELTEGKCLNEACAVFNKKLYDHQIEICYFIPIKDQLQRILTEHWDKIISYKRHHVHGFGVYSDICCGEVYQRKPGKNNPQQLISLVYHIDGAPAVKSKSVNLWPIQCFVVELPPELRYCFSNILVCGISCGPKKPDLKIFQEKFVTEIQEIQGGEVKVASSGAELPVETVDVHGHLADLVAKAPSLCFCQFNGQSGCSVCLHPGERINKGKGNIRVYPYNHEDPPLRTHEQTLLHASTAERTGKPVFGVKGVSPLLRVIEVPDKVLLDYMHLVLAGEFLRRINIWINPRSDNGFLSDVKEEVDEAMLAVKFPHDFNRKLRPLNELKRWKDRELQNLLLHASLPIVKPHFPPQHFYHFALFVTAIRLLTADTITDRDIDLAKLLIRSYQRLMLSLYGETEETYTCHALMHLPDQVRKHGPLILHSSFVFEAMISHLKRQFHGTRGIIAQIIRNLLFAQNSGSLIKRETMEPEEVKSFMEDNITTKKDKNRHHVEGHCFFMLPFTSNPQLPETVIQQLDLQGQAVHLANRMVIDSQMYHSLAYSRKGESCSFIVQFSDGSEDEFGKVKYYLLARDTGFVVLCKYEKLGNICSFGLDEEPEDVVVKAFNENGTLGTHFQAVKETRTVHCVSWRNIVCRCVFVQSEEDRISGYVCPVLRHYQHD